MWNHQHAGTTTAAPELVWAALRDLHSGIALSERSDVFELHGPFALGTRVSVTPQGQQRFTSTIVEFDEGHSYADLTEFGGVTLLFRHRLEALADGGTRIVHALTIDGPDAESVGPELGPQIVEDFPATMDDLIAAAESRATGAA